MSDVNDPHRHPTSHDGSSSEEDPRYLGARVVNAVYRLIKACQIHADSNQAVAQVVEFVLGTVGAFCERAKVDQIAILFTKQAVFVNRQMLRASRETYQLALELGAILESFDVTEIALSRETTAVELSEFGRYVSELQREAKKHPRLTEGGWDGLKLRKVVGFSNGSDLPPPVRAARTYAAALMLVRSFYSDIRAGSYELKQGIKRVAQKLVSQNDAGARLLVTIAATPPTESDRAAMLLNTAILAVAMASQVTDDRTLLTSLASAALLYDAGRQRLIGYAADESRAARRLNQDEEELLPTSGIVALTALGKLHPPAVTRAVLVHEALAMREGRSPYGGKRQPALLSKVLHAARSFVELRVPRTGSLPIGIDDTLEILESQSIDNTTRAIVKLIAGALGVFPAGTMVELSTGEMAVVLATPKLPVDFARPPVRVMYDADAQLIADPLDVDLAEMRQPGQPVRFIVKTVDTTDQQMKQMRAYVVQLAQKRARKHSVDKMRAVATVPPPGRAPAAAPNHVVAIIEPNPIEPPPSAKPSAREPSPGTHRWDPRSEQLVELIGHSVVAPKDADSPASALNRGTASRLTPLASPSVSEAPPPSPRDGTDALLAAYLAEEGEQSAAASQSPDAASKGHGIRWSERNSAHGTPTDSPSHGGKSAGFGSDRSQTPVSNAFGGPARTTGFGSSARGITGTPAPAPSSGGRPTGASSASGFGSSNRGITGGSSASGFGSSSRGITGASATGHSSASRSMTGSLSSGFGSSNRGVTGGTPVGFGSDSRGMTGSRGAHAGLRLGGSPSSGGHEHDSFAKQTDDPFADEAPLSPAPPPARPSAPQPLRGSLGRVNSAANWAAVREAPPSSLEPRVEEAPEPPPQPPPSSVVESTQPRRAKAGTQTWGKK